MAAIIFPRVITRGKMIAAMFLQSAHAMGLALHPIQPVTEPAQGAIRLALQTSEV